MTRHDGEISNTRDNAAAKPRWIVRYRAWVRLHKHWKHAHPWRQAWIDAR